MRLLERTLIEVDVFDRQVIKDALGGQREAFSENARHYRATRLPLDGTFQRSEGGIVSVERIRLLLPQDAQIGIGDGVYADGKMYCAEYLNTWTAHREVICRLL